MSLLMKTIGGGVGAEEGGQGPRFSSTKPADRVIASWNTSSDTSLTPVEEDVVRHLLQQVAPPHQDFAVEYMIGVGPRLLDAWRACLTESKTQPKRPFLHHFAQRSIVKSSAELERLIEQTTRAYQELGYTLAGVIQNSSAPHKKTHVFRPIADEVIPTAKFKKTVAGVEAGQSPLQPAIFFTVYDISAFSSAPSYSHIEALLGGKAITSRQYFEILNDKALDPQAKAVIRADLIEENSAYRLGETGRINHFALHTSDIETTMKTYSSGGDRPLNTLQEQEGEYRNQQRSDYGDPKFVEMYQVDVSGTNCNPYKFTFKNAKVLFQSTNPDVHLQLLHLAQDNGWGGEVDLDQLREVYTSQGFDVPPFVEAAFSKFSEVSG